MAEKIAKDTYVYKHKTYENLADIRKQLPLAFIPNNPTEAQLNFLNISVVHGYEEVSTTSLESLKAERLKELEVATEAAIVGGFESTCSGVILKYDSDIGTQVIMNSIAIATDTDLFNQRYPNGCPCRGYVKKEDGTYETEKTVQTLTAEQCKEFVADLVTHIGACKLKGWEYQAKVNAATSEEELSAIEFKF